MIEWVVVVLPKSTKSYSFVNVQFCLPTEMTSRSSFPDENELGRKQYTTKQKRGHGLLTGFPVDNEGVYPVKNDTVWPASYGSRYDPGDQRNPLVHRAGSDTQQRSRRKQQQAALTSEALAPSGASSEMCGWEGLRRVGHQDQGCIQEKGIHMDCCSPHQGRITESVTINFRSLTSLQRQTPFPRDTNGESPLFGDLSSSN